MTQKKSKLHELPYTELVKSGTHNYTHQSRDFGTLHGG